MSVYMYIYTYNGVGRALRSISILCSLTHSASKSLRGGGGSPPPPPKVRGAFRGGGGGMCLLSSTKTPSHYRYARS